MGCRTHAGGAKIELVRIGLGGRHQVLQCSDGTGRTNEERHRYWAQHGDPGEVFLRVVAQVLVDELGVAQRRRRAEIYHVAIFGSACRRGSGDRTARTRLVYHNDGIAHAGGQLVRNQARREIHCTRSSRVRHDQFDRAIGIVGVSRRRQASDAGSGEECVKQRGFQHEMFPKWTSEGAWSGCHRSCNDRQRHRACYRHSKWVAINSG